MECQRSAPVIGKWKFKLDAGMSTKLKDILRWFFNIRKIFPDAKGTDKPLSSTLYPQKPNHSYMFRLLSHYLQAIYKRRNKNVKL
jgi:hypothetical protein